MRAHFRRPIALLFVLVALVSMQNRASFAAGAADIPNDRAAVEHALNRLAFGPKPGQVEAVRRLGLARWIDQQLTPSAIDDAALAARLTPLPDRPGDVGLVAARNLSEQERMEAQRLAENRRRTTPTSAGTAWSARKILPSCKSTFSKRARIIAVALETSWVAPLPPSPARS